MIVAGAVYIPLALIVPTPAGLIVHVTAWFDVFATVAVKLCVPFADSVAAPGATLTDTGGGGGGGWYEDPPPQPWISNNADRMTIDFSTTTEIANGFRVCVPLGGNSPRTF